MMSRTNEPLLPPTDAGLPEWVRNGQLQSSSARPDGSDELRPHLLTLADAANQLRISPRTVRRMVKSGKLTALRIGRQLRFDRDTLYCEISNLDNCRD